MIANNEDSKEGPIQKEDNKINSNLLLNIINNLKNSMKEMKKVIEKENFKFQNDINELRKENA